MGRNYKQFLGSNYLFKDNYIKIIDEFAITDSNKK